MQVLYVIWLRNLIYNKASVGKTSEIVPKVSSLGLNLRFYAENSLKWFQTIPYISRLGIDVTLKLCKMFEIEFC